MCTETTGQEKEAVSLSQGVIIDNFFYEFEMKSLYNGFVQMMIPNAFFEMPPELCYLKYGLTQPLGYLVMSPDCAVDMNISVIDNFAVENPLIDTVKESQQALHRSNPGCVYDSDYITLAHNENEMVISSATVQTVDCVIKSYYGHLLTGRQVVAVTLNTPYADDSMWKDVFCELMKSIEIQYGIHTKFSKF